MTEYTYIARNTSGQQVSGTVEAHTEQEVLSELAQRVLYPVRIEAARSLQTASFFKPRIKQHQLAIFYSQLSDLLRAGVPLLRAFEILEQQSTQPGFSVVLRQVRENVAEGKSLSEAMKHHPRIFNELSVSMVRAGQEGGFLEGVLQRIAMFTTQQQELRSRVVGAAVYPVFLLIFGFIIVGILTTFFVPKFESFFSRLREAGKLPWVTEALMQVSAFLTDNGWWILLLIISGISALWYFRDSPAWKQWLDGIKLRLPGAGPIFLYLAIARFCRVLGTLLHNGVPILPALRISKDSTGNHVLSNAVAEAADNISAGESLGKPLRACGHFPPDVVEMISVGEESNNLEEVLIQIAETTEQRTARQLELFVRLLEPVLLIVMAAIVLVVIVALLLPIFRQSQLMG